MAVRIQIAATYKREIQVELPGDGLKPEKKKIVAVFNDLDPAELATDQEKISGALTTLLKLIKSMRTGSAEANDAELADAESQIEAIGDVTPKIDRVLAGVEGLEVIGRDGQPLQGDELIDFVKRYPRLSRPIMLAWEKENGSAEPAHLGNLLRSVAPGRG